MGSSIVTGDHPGYPGLPISGYAYEREGLALEIGTSKLRLSALATDLHDEIDSLGQTVHRYYFLHRLQSDLSRRLSLALWEGVVLAGADRNFETRYRNPLSLSYLASTIGLGDRGNVLLGVDARWRAFGRTTLQAQIAVDDFWYQNRQRNRDRWGFTLSAEGPLAERQHPGAACTLRSRALRFGRSTRTRTSPMRVRASAGTSATTTSSRSESHCP